MITKYRTLDDWLVHDITNKDHYVEKTEKGFLLVFEDKRFYINDIDYIMGKDGKPLGIIYETMP